MNRLEESVQRHKAHTLNLEIMMRLVENETLPAEEADDVRDLIEDYLERNQEDFDEFDVVDDMYEFKFGRVGDERKRESGDEREAVTRGVRTRRLVRIAAAVANSLERRIVED